MTDAPDGKSRHPPWSSGGPAIFGSADRPILCASGISRSADDNRGLPV